MNNYFSWGIGEFITNGELCGGELLNGKWPDARMENFPAVNCHWKIVSGDMMNENCQDTISCLSYFLILSLIADEVSQLQDDLNAKLKEASSKLDMGGETSETAVLQNVSNSHQHSESMIADKHQHFASEVWHVLYLLSSFKQRYKICNTEVLM